MLFIKFSDGKVVINWRQVLTDGPIDELYWEKLNWLLSSRGGRVMGD